MVLPTFWNTFWRIIWVILSVNPVQVYSDPSRVFLRGTARGCDDANHSNNWGNYDVPETTTRPHLYSIHVLQHWSQQLIIIIMFEVTMCHMISGHAVGGREDKSQLERSKSPSPTLFRKAQKIAKFGFQKREKIIKDPPSIPMANESLKVSGIPLKNITVS